MSLAMPDSIRVADLPPGYPAYLGYVDGKWPTAPDLVARFPGAHIVELTVIGNTLHADGCDIEYLDLTPSSGAAWCAEKLGSEPASRPVAYASVSAMPAVLEQLAARGVARSSVRLLSAHYEAGQHICGPSTCAWPGVPAMDGTQWTDTFSGAGGNLVDMSMLLDSFFGTPPPPVPSWEDQALATIPTVQHGSTGQFVRNWQGLLAAHGYSLAPAGIDGVFGSTTDQRTRAYQSNHGLMVDGIVGPQTWTRAMTS
jgi:hypothetical protein